MTLGISLRVHALFLPACHLYLLLYVQLLMSLMLDNLASSVLDARRLLHHRRLGCLPWRCSIPTVVHILLIKHFIIRVKHFVQVIRSLVAGSLCVPDRLILRSTPILALNLTLIHHMVAIVRRHLVDALVVLIDEVTLRHWFDVGVLGLEGMI